jgi:hypothetical protein
MPQTTSAPARSQAHLDQIIGHGSFFVATADGRALHPEHVEALFEYLSGKLKGYSGDVEVTVDEHLETLSKEEFVEFWSRWVERHPGAEKVVSPYEV